ncbi:MAG: sigma-70 family RNA polymerase sigma factor [Planctomycetes bacterium]|nr:sigma-70 family RNA polymerase sigma factor [Planctomycetota bacterium]
MVKELFLRCADGDPEAWREFDGLYRPMLCALAARALARYGPSSSQEAEDCVGEAIAALLANDGARLRAYDPAYRPSTWLKLSLLDAVHRHLNREGRQRGRSGGEALLRAVSPVTGPDAAASLAEDLERVRAALAARPARERLALRWLYEECLERKDVARLLGLTESGVSKLAGRALRSLRDALG